MDVFCVFFLLSSQHRLSTVSVVFDFNDSLNDVAPGPSIVLPIDVKRKETDKFASGCLLGGFFCLHPSD